MKRLLTILFFLPAFASLAQQPYSPSIDGQSVARPLGATNFPTDGRTQFHDRTNFLWRDYRNTAEVLTTLNTANHRKGGVLIFIHNGGTLGSNGLYTGGTREVYWFKDGTADINLVPFAPGGTSFDSTKYQKKLIAGEGIVIDTINNVITSTAIGVGGGGGDSTFISVESLRLFAGVNNRLVRTTGYYSQNDGGQGEFIYSAASTAPDNGGTVIKPTSVSGAGRWLRRYSGALNVKWFGAIPNGSRVVTANLQAALNQGGNVSIPYDANNYLIDDVLLLKSGTSLVVDPNSTIYEVSGTNTIMLRNQNLNATGITDTSISVSGGTWDMNWAGNPGTHLFSASYSLIQSSKTGAVKGASGLIGFYGVRNISVTNLTVKNANIFSIQIAGCNDVLVEHIRFIRTENTISDGVHLNGPINNYTVRDINGTTGDDFIALNAWDWRISTPTPGGDMTNGLVENLRPNPSKWSAVKMVTGDNAGVHGVTIRNIKGVSSNQAFHWGYAPDGEDNTHITVTKGKISGVKLEDIAVATTFGQVSGGIQYGTVLNVNADVNDIHIDGVEISSFYKPVDGLPWFHLLPGATIKDLSVSNFKVTDSVNFGNMFKFSGYADNFSLNNVVARSNGSFTGNKAVPFITAETGGGGFGYGSLSNVKLYNYYGLYQQKEGGADASINFTNSELHEFKDAFAFNGVNHLNISSSYFFENHSSIVRVTGAGSDIAVYSASSLSIPGANGGSTLIRSAGAVKWNGTDLPVNSSRLTPVTLDIVKDSVIGLQQYNGTAWVPISNSGQWATVANEVIRSSIDNTGVLSSASGTGKAGYFGAVSGDFVNTRLQSGASSGFAGTLSNHPFEIWTNGVKRASMPAAGIGDGATTMMVTLDANKNWGTQAIPSGGSSQWTTVANEVNWSTASHTGAVSQSTTSGFAGYLAAISGDGVNARLQSNATSAFVGTLNNHPFEIWTNGVKRASFPAAGFGTISGPMMVTLDASNNFGVQAIPSGGAGSGTVTSVGLTMPAGFSASTSNATTTPAISVTTTLAGILRGTGSGFASTTIGTGLQFDGTTLRADTTVLDARYTTALSFGTGFNYSAGVVSLDIGNRKVLPDANYTVTVNDRYLILPAPTTTRTITLPAASALSRPVSIECFGTTVGEWILAGSYVQKTTTGGSLTENFSNSGLPVGAMLHLVPILLADGVTWRWFDMP